MKKSIVILVAIMLLLTGCGNNLDSKNVQMLSELSCAETIKQQLDALILAADIGYQFERINEIYPRDLYAYIGGRAVSFFEVEGDGYCLSEDECQQILNADFGIDYIPFQYPASPEYTVETGTYINYPVYSIAYSIEEVEENAGMIVVIIEKRAYLNRREDIYLSQRIKYKFDATSNSPIILGAEML